MRWTLNFVLAIFFFGGDLHAQTKSIYLAGPLFSVAERQFNSMLATRLRERGYEVFLPQEVEPREMTAQAIFALDVEGIDRAHVVVAIFDGPDPDSGTSWECGYAYAKGKAIVAVRTDFRNVSDGGLAPYNLMLTESASRQVNVSSLKSDIETVANCIEECLKTL